MYSLEHATKYTTRRHKTKVWDLNLMYGVDGDSSLGSGSLEKKIKGKLLEILTLRGLETR